LRISVACASASLFCLGVHGALGLVAFVCNSWASSPAIGAHRVRRSASAGTVAELKAPQSRIDLGTIESQNLAGHELRELGRRLQGMAFSASSPDGNAQVIVDGMQRVKLVHLAPEALEFASGRPALASAVLELMQEAHDASVAGTEEDIWHLYRDNVDLMQAPLVQIGAGNTVEDPWANVSLTDETVALAEEVFSKFDVDGDGYWNFEETSQVQMATEGSEMLEESFNTLIIAAAEDGGRHLTEEALKRGLSKQQVVDLYTDAALQRQLGFVLDIKSDHRTIFSSQAESGSGSSGVDAI